MLHPLVAVWLVIAILLILTPSRASKLAPVFLWSCFSIPIGQVVVLGRTALYSAAYLNFVGVGSDGNRFEVPRSKGRLAGGFNGGRPGGGAMDIFRH